MKRDNKVRAKCIFRTVATFANRLQKIKLVTNFTNIIIALFLHLITTVSFNKRK